MSTISLTVKPIAGSDVAKVFQECSTLAAFLGLAWVEFKFNGDHGTAYPDGHGFLLNGGAHTVATWSRQDGFKWKDKL